MMGIRVDPRTGMIIKGPSRPSKFPPSSDRKRVKKSGNMYPAKLAKQVLSAPMSLPPIKDAPALSPEEKLEAWASIVGKAIAAQLLPALSQPREIIRETVAVSGSANVQVAPDTGYSVDIDESIVDVGIGKAPPLKRGAESGNMKQDTKADNLSKTKQKLRALKGRS